MSERRIDRRHAVVSKLPRFTLAPTHTGRLTEFLQTVPTASALKLDAAAACDGFRQRHMWWFALSSAVVEAMVHEKGALDAGGHAVG